MSFILCYTHINDDYQPAGFINTDRIIFAKRTLDPRMLELKLNEDQGEEPLFADAKSFQTTFIKG